MKGTLVTCSLGLLLVSGSLLHGEEPGGLTYALQPLDEGVPQVAVMRLRALLAGRLPNEQRLPAMGKLGEALVAAGEAEEALKILAEPALRDLPASKFFRAQALAALKRWNEALPLYAECVTIGAPYRSEALFGQAECERALGKRAEALQTLASLTSDARWKLRAQLGSVELLVEQRDPAGASRLLDSLEPRTAAEKKERRLLRGRIAAAENHPEKAAELFASILKSPEGAPHSVLTADLFAIADAHLQMGTPEAGDDFLEAFIDRHPTDEELPLIFAKLDQLYAAERKQSRHEYSRWSKDPAQPRRALAQWYLAKVELRLARPEAAEQILEQLRVTHTGAPFVAEALLDYARLEAEDGRVDHAVALLEEARALHPVALLLDRINLLSGRCHYTAGRFAVAGGAFQPVAYSESRYANDALFDTALAQLQAGDSSALAATTQELKQRGADDETRGDLLLEEGLAQAAKGEKEAAGSLQKFIHDFPKHSRLSEAWVALAELAFHATPPRTEEAQQKLARAVEGGLTPAAAERSDYLSLWIEESRPAPNETRIIALATEFLQKYNESSLLPDVRLKLAELYFRRQDFASAQTQFEILAQHDPASPLAERAKFFAAESAMKSMGAASLDRALVYFDEVVKKNGELKWAARNEQAVIERKLGKGQDALTLYDEVLKGDANSAEKLEALCGKGDILYDLGASDPENYKRAIEIYNQMAAQRDASPHWRNQALFKKGMCLEKSNAPGEALATFYQVVEDESRPDRRREFFWFYKAGFNAARLLEEQSKWQPAAAIYEKLAFAGGARSEEAKSRLSRLRLEHFLWD